MYEFILPLSSIIYITVNFLWIFRIILTQKINYHMVFCRRIRNGFPSSMARPRIRRQRHDGDETLNYKHILRYVIAAAVILAAGYFFYQEFKNNADALRQYKYAVDPLYIFISVILGTSGFLVGPVVWRICVNHYIRKKLTLLESIALYNTSALLKYIPGKIWTYAAQMALLSSRGISNALVVYINLISFVCFFFVSAIIASFYYFVIQKVTPPVITALLLALLITLDVIFIVWNTTIINSVVIPLGRLFKIELEPIQMKKRIFIYVQIWYFIAYAFLGVAMFFLARGIGMHIPFFNIFAITATISISAILGYIAFFSPGGLGVREGMMFIMLRQYATVEVALILPIAARLLCIVADLVLGAVGISVGMRRGYFPRLAHHPRTQTIAEKAEPDTNG